MDPMEGIFQGVFVILVLINLAGNILVCAVVLRAKSMRTPMNYLLINLAIADMTVALFFAPQYILRPMFQHPEGRLGDCMCKLLTGGSLSWVGLASSVFTLVSIAFERYCSILFPHSKYGRLTAERAYVGIAVSWFLAVVSEIPSMAVVKYSKEHKVCFEDWPHISQARTYTGITFFLDFALPFTLMSVLYGQVIRKLWSKRVSLATHIALLKRRKKVTKLLATLTVLHGICLLPDTVAYVLSYCGFKYGSIFLKVGTVFVCLNSTMNPFLYSLHSERFRQALRVLLRIRVGGLGRERVVAGQCYKFTAPNYSSSLRRSKTSVV